VHTLESQVGQLLVSCLRLSPEGDRWDAQGKRLTNVSPGSLPNDVGTLSQVCIFDQETSSLLCAGIKYFDSVEINKRISTLETATSARDKRVTSVEDTANGISSRVLILESDNKLRDERITSVENATNGIAGRLDNMDSVDASRDQRVSAVEGRINGFNDTLHSLESSNDTRDQRLNGIDVNVNGIVNRVESLESGGAARDKRVLNIEQTANGTSTLVQSLTSTVTNIHNVVLNDCMRVRADGKWDGKDRTIANVALGDSMDEVSTMGQTCTYVVETTNFRCGTTHFDLVQNSSSTPVLCASWNAVKAGWSLMPYRGSNEIFPYWALRYSPGTVLDSNGNRVVWDEWKKEFTQYELSSLKRNVFYIQPPDE